MASVILCSMLLIPACADRGQPASEYRTVAGETMGTYYRVTSNGGGPELQLRVDSLLEAFNRIFSTYDPASSISDLNAAPGPVACIDDRSGQFRTVLEVAALAFDRTGGNFDPTVLPLVAYWGFAEKKFSRTDVDSSAIDSLLDRVGFHRLSWQVHGDSLCLDRGLPPVSLDLSAIAKGYAVDLVSGLLRDSQVEDYLVDIGGEITAAGRNDRGEAWTVAIDRPVFGSDLSDRRPHAVVPLSDASVASSGNYRNFYELDGNLVGHTMDPTTGYPQRNDLLAVSVMTRECVYADALATGFMASGYGRARAAVDSLAGVEALFILADSLTGDPKTEMTPGFGAQILSPAVPEESRE